MKDIFREALKRNPDAGLARKVDQSIADSEWSQKELERGKEVTVLGDKLYLLGSEWYRLRVNPRSPKTNVGLSIEQIKAEWRRVREKMSDKRRGEKNILLGRFSEGMWLSEEHMEVNYTLLAEGIKIEELTAASKLLLLAVSDLSEYSDEEDKIFRKFVTGTNISGKTDLPKVFGAVSLWLDMKPI